MVRRITGALCLGLVVSVSAVAQGPLTVKNVLVFKETNKFAGWPANNGLWAWGNEMVVGFKVGAFDDDKQGGHPIQDPQTQRQARTLDGGETWTIEKPSFLDENEQEPEPTELNKSMDFKHPDFALKFRSQGSAYYYSTDRCKTWNGPHGFPNFGMTARAGTWVIRGVHSARTGKS